MVACAVLEPEGTLLFISSQGSQDLIWTCLLPFWETRFCVGHYSPHMKKCIYWHGSKETFTKMWQLADIFTSGLNGFNMLVGRKKLWHTSEKVAAFQLWVKLYLYKVIDLTGILWHQSVYMCYMIKVVCMQECEGVLLIWY